MTSQWKLKVAIATKSAGLKEFNTVELDTIKASVKFKLHSPPQLLEEVFSNLYPLSNHYHLCNSAIWTKVIRNVSVKKIK